MGLLLRNVETISIVQTGWLQPTGASYRMQHSKDISFKILVDLKRMGAIEHGPELELVHFALSVS